MPREPEQAVIDIQRIHIDGLDHGWPGRHRVKISNLQIAEWIAFETEIRLEILFGGVAKREVPDGGQQNWPMKNEKEPHAYREGNHHPSPDVPVTPAL